MPQTAGNGLSVRGEDSLCEGELVYADAESCRAQTECQKLLPKIRLCSG